MVVTLVGVRGLGALRISALNLVEGVAVAVRGSVQLQLAWRLEAVRCGRSSPGRGRLGLRSVVVLVVLGHGRDRSHRGGMVVVDRGRGRGRGRGRVLVLAEVGVVPARIVLAVVVVAAATVVLRLRLVLWTIINNSSSYTHRH